MSEIMSRRDLDFLLFEWLKTDELLTRPLFDDYSSETVGALLDLAEQLATTEFAPHNRKSDLNEPTYDGKTVTVIPEVGQALRAFSDAGFLSASIGIDGMSPLPGSVFAACMSWFQAANSGTMAYAMLTHAAANLLRKHGTPEQVERYAVPMNEGRWFGTMMLSEPHAGSNLADIVTRAEPQPDGTYRIFGQKMWISAGEHELTENIVHLVLARTPGAPAGTKGISLFLVPKILVNDDGTLGERNDLTLAGVNHKMGFRGTVNTAPVLGDGATTPAGKAGAVGYLVGAENRGMPLMFSMMNEARIGVGLCAASLGYTGYLKSLAYARERLQGRPLGADASTPQVTLVEHPDVRRMLLAQKSYAEGSIALIMFAARLSDDSESAADETEREAAGALLSLLTPIVKSWPSQYGVVANDLAIQVMGGAGYTRDYDVEQHYRDNRLNSIHEGTHGIQALDLLGRKVLLDGGKALGLLVGRIQQTTDRARVASEEGAALADRLNSAVADVVATTGALATLGDPARIMADATAYLEAVGHVVVAWLWLEQWLAAHGKAGEFYDGKRAAATYFFTRELPKVGPMLALLRDADGLTLGLDPAVL
jgi:alkylation response protein AidB-like acyl-CoA dehydrogenase